MKAQLLLLSINDDLEKSNKIISSQIDDCIYKLSNYHFDLLEPLYLKIEQNDDIQRLKEIKLFCHSNELINIDVNMMKLLIPDFITKKNNYYLYKLHFDKIIENGSIINIKTGELKLVLKDDNYNNIQLIEKQYVFKQYLRFKIYNNNSLKCCTFIKNQTIIPNNEATIYIQHCNFNNGFFIKTKSDITNIKIFFNNELFQEYDNLLIDLCIKKYGKYYYIPFNDNQLFEFNNNTINTSKINEIKIYVKSSNDIGKLKIKMLDFNYIINSLYNMYILYSKSNFYINEKDSPKYKLYTGDDICLISHEDIKINDRYMECNYCYKCYIEEYLKLWLSNNDICPYCYNVWTNDIIYKNNKIE